MCVPVLNCVFLLLYGFVEVGLGKISIMIIKVRSVIDRGYSREFLVHRKCINNNMTVNPIHQHRLIMTWLLYWITLLLAILSRPLLITVWLHSDYDPFLCGLVSIGLVTAIEVLNE